VTSAWLCMRERVLVQLLGSVAIWWWVTITSQVGMVGESAGRGPFVRGVIFCDRRKYGSDQRHRSHPHPLPTPAA
jgi:hypothetical protein